MASPFDSPHLYVQWGGKLPGNEQWSCGFRMRKKTSGTIDSGSGLLVGVSAALATFHAAGGSHIHTGAKLSFVKVNALDTAGHYSSPGTNQALYSDLAGAAAGLAQPPNQICLAVSLTTGFSRGMAHRGRFYLPMPNMAVASDGRIADIDADAVSDSVDDLITNVNSVNSDYEMAVFSRGRTVGGTVTVPPGNRKITGNLVGRVLDTQRRRRRSLVEAYA